MLRTMRLLAAVVLAVAACVPAAAWEFNLRAEFELRYRYISRTGPNDLFGNAEVAQSGYVTNLPWPYTTSIGLSGPNNRMVQIEGYSSKGSDGAYSEERLWVYPKVKVNEAVSLQCIISFSGNLNGTYNPPNLPNIPVTTVSLYDFNDFNYYVGPSENWATNPHYSGWIMTDSRDTVRGVPMAAGLLQAAWATVRLPWGTLVFGRRPAGFGMGWVVHEDDNYTTSLSLIVPWGPVSFVFSQYLHSNGEYTDPNNAANRFADYRFLIPNFRTWTNTVPAAVDQNKVIDWNQAFAGVYRSGSLDLGVMGRIVRWSNIHAASRANRWPPDLVPPYPHGGVGFVQAGPLVGTFRDDAIALTFATQPEFGASVNPISAFLGDNAAFQTTPYQLVPMYGDMFFLLGTTYLKYTTGALSLNAEYDFQFIEVRRKGGRPVSGFPQAWATEVSYMTGPLKVSLAHFYRSGHDRRHGNFGTYWALGGEGFPPVLLYAHDQWNFFLTAWGGGQTPIAPYNHLLGLYGTGNNSYNSAGTCTYKDFLAYAARIDYAIAANLNLFGSFIHAERASNTGTPVGLYGGQMPWERGIAEVPVGGYASSNVPDNDLGWEADLGFNWKLLENFSVNFLFAYWQPGTWFKWAYWDRSRWDYVLDNRVNPFRPIDALIGIQTSLLVDF